MSEILDIAAALSRLLKAENVLLICQDVYKRQRAKWATPMWACRPA